MKTATSGAECIVEISHDTDVLLLDRRMPNMSGDEVLEAVNQIADNIRVIMVTAVEPEEDILEMEFDDYITKPVTEEELKERIEKLLIFNRYEDKLTTYYTTVKKRTLLSQEISDTKLEQLDKKLDKLESEIQTIIQQFPEELQNGMSSLNSIPVKPTQK